MLSIGRFARCDGVVGKPLYSRDGGEGSSSGSGRAPLPSPPSSSSSPATSPPPIMSQSTFLLGSLSIFAIGLLLGVRRAVKHEKQTMKSVVNDIEGMAFGAKAFFWGTALCFGTAIGAGTLFVYTTGIQDAPTFGRVAKQKIAELGIIPLPQPETEEQCIEREQLEQDAAKAYDDIFGEESEEEKERKANMTWQDKLARVYDLKKMIEKSLGMISEEKEEGSQADTKKKDQPVYTDDKPKWQQKLERIFGLSKGDGK